MQDFFARLSWADYIAAGFLIRGLYVGHKSGIFIELLRTVAHLTAVIVALVAYTPLAQYLTVNTFLNESAAKTVGIAATFIIAFLVAAVLRKVIIKVLKVNEGGGLQRVLGALLGGARWIVLLSLIFMAVGHLPLKQLQADVQQRSLTGAAISQVAPALFGFTGQLTAQWMPAGQGKTA